MTEAISPTTECITVLESNVDSIEEKHENLPQVLNGLEGSISNKTYDSIKLLEWSLMQLQSNNEDYDKYDVNLLSSMTLDIKHLHSPVNYKGFWTMLQYAHSFASSIKESLKSLTQWSTYYFTSKDSWYSLQESSINFKDIKMPAPLPSAKMTAENKETMWEWASANRNAVRQRAMRQETIMAKAGALPESCYHHELKPTDANEKI